MRHLLTLILSIGSLTAFGQASLLTGSYSDTLADHQINLTLQDNEEFRADEILKEGRRTLFGTWTFRNNMITLTTTKIFFWEWTKPKEKNELDPTDFPDMFVSVDKDLQ